MTELQYAMQAGLTIEVKEDKAGEVYATWKLNMEGVGQGAYYLNDEELAMVNAYNGVEEVEEAKTFEQTLVELFGDKFEIKNAQIKSLLNEKVLGVKQIGKGFSAKYVFDVENDKENHYRLSATLTGKGKWWVKRGRFGF